MRQAPGFLRKPGFRHRRIKKRTSKLLKLASHRFSRSGFETWTRCGRFSCSRRDCSRNDGDGQYQRGKSIRRRRNRHCALQPHGPASRRAIEIGDAHRASGGANFGQVLSVNCIPAPERIEFVQVPPGGGRELPVGDDEVFVTTSWWTTRSVRPVVDPSRIVYLLQEDERMFYGHGDDRLRCAETMADPHIRFVINSKLLFEHLTKGPSHYPISRTVVSGLSPPSPRLTDE